ncbi:MULTISPECIES: hypothetical protein [unclassified Brevundimonas]|uniref:hypothetical protein n=1 Tax=unclassified Brevundimonas TaxID=2622653 RepID=UPI000CFD1CB7|nr:MULTISPECIES: hypothetical protein [unclassified Brevundimonas]PRA26160.1 hypothetical protein CQ024_13550 [Brevundimonas sp. MYb27]PQZ81718.1 hypothetical protein CQ026_09495 [Brevundimonas sp. MYb31]PRB17513.1 hypothetical protein CQ039_00215 [Brevundimonas sp. MYb52]PRB37886.1 hypothetical protein CQ035_00215 [Brevundimonas sp. MYb46]PRB45772.1 hypothetical protein CQ028_12525 [Brevundimonas sp. MYb33]
MTDIARRQATPWHLWLVGGLSLLWNATGVWQWYQQVTGAPAYWDALTAAEAAYLRAAPVWTDVAFGAAVWCGLLGAMLLLFRRRLAFNAFIAGLIAMLADSVYVHFLSNGREVMGAAGMGFGLLVILIFIGQIAYSRWARGKAIIR